MTSNSSGLKQEIESFKQFTCKLSDKINSVDDLWRDNNYTSLQSQIGELAKVSRTVIENGEKACSATNGFFAVSNEDVR